MTKLSVNINKIATLRNSRGGDVPNVVKCAVDVQRFGAEGITVHPRPDQRHITRQDVYDLKPVIVTEYNIEGYPSAEFMKMVEQVRPHQVTLVPDLPEAITSDTGWDTIKHASLLKDIISDLKEVGIRTSIFVNPEAVMIEGAAKIGADRIELYTEPYATHYRINRDEAIAPYVVAAELAHKLGLKVNAGHDLSLENLAFFSQHIPNLKEVSIGHALVADALYLGLEKTVQMYKEQLVKR